MVASSRCRPLHPAPGARSVRLAVRSYADLVTLGVGEHTERCSRNLLRRLDNCATQLDGPSKGGGYIIDRHEEENLVFRPLARADRDIGATFDSSVNEGVPGETSFGGNLPIEEVCVELSGPIRICRTDFGMYYGMRHCV